MRSGERTVPRVVVDTNVWVSALLNRHGYPAQVLSALQAGRFTALVSNPLLSELAEVLSRPRIARKYGVTQTDGEELATLVRERGVEVTVTGSLRLCRDPDDDVILETALLGGADVVVSRDEDLKGDEELVRVLLTAGIETLSVRRFLLVLDEVKD
jgi:putative PIN family toxin of toxin-antitoxin system